jgi:hypothetical protein
MLDALKKRFLNAIQEEVEMVEPKTEQPQAAVTNTAELSALAAQLASQSEALLAVQTQFAELSSKYEEAQASLSAVEQAKENLIIDAKAKQLASRKAKVEAAIGTAKAPSLLAATETLDDVSFEAIVTSLATSLEDEAKTKMFVETGVAGEADAVEDEKPVHFNKFIKTNKEAK